MDSTYSWACNIENNIDKLTQDMENISLCFSNLQEKLAKLNEQIIHIAMDYTEFISTHGELFMRKEEK